ncbi:hypothetical protein H5410_049050 [Solanum commersonii]|uniref:Uncharacterized protein n=1 Tax=Solanum commersonii TaxID=4109 RepID=A0A9J5XNG4_SOLCO|nr:hypothetical protein H5410_049050 [Solanum commersonii]
MSSSIRSNQFQSLYYHQFAGSYSDLASFIAKNEESLRYRLYDTHTSNNNDQYDYVPLDRGRLFLHVDETEVIGFDYEMLSFDLTNMWIGEHHDLQPRREWIVNKKKSKADLT